MAWLDWAWRLPVAFFVRVPLMISFFVFSKLSSAFHKVAKMLKLICDHTPGVPYYPPWHRPRLRSR